MSFFKLFSLCGFQFVRTYNNKFINALKYHCKYVAFNPVGIDASIQTILFRYRNQATLWNAGNQTGTPMFYWNF